MARGQLQREVTRDDESVARYVLAAIVRASERRPLLMPGESIYLIRLEADLGIGSASREALIGYLRQLFRLMQLDLREDALQRAASVRGVLSAVVGGGRAENTRAAPLSDATTAWFAAFMRQQLPLRILSVGAEGGDAESDSSELEMGIKERGSSPRDTGVGKSRVEMKHGESVNLMRHSYTDAFTPPPIANQRDTSSSTRVVNIWTDDADIVEGHTALVSVDVGPPRNNADPLERRFNEPAWTNVRSIRIAFMMSSEAAKIEEGIIYRELLPTGSTESAHFHVTPRIDGTLLLVLRVFDTRDWHLLQQVSADLDVRSADQLAMRA